MDAIATDLCEFAKTNKKLPILANLMSLESDPAFDQQLNNANIPNFDFPETDIRVLASMIKYYDWINQPPSEPVKFEVNKNEVQKTLDTIRKENRTHLSEPESYQVLEAYGMKAVSYQVAKDLDKTLLAAGKIGYPVVLKIVSADIMHKIDVGGVKINLKDENDLKAAFTEMSKSIKKKSQKRKFRAF